ncbi:serine carboxypeptidase-like enzyme [Selaginella moellendorffii]|uniref:Carboxypeptidase n=1 Tax=Selaginella moellendorffii TaxID=88036 RepID=D8QV65_SELML|nr:serine carboxypeptidase-like enzyme [Selaginella moellendorffii]
MTLHLLLLLLHSILILVLASSSAIDPAQELDWEAAQRRDRVERLPGQPKTPPLRQFSGYIPVSRDGRRALFYWLTESTARSPHSKPLVLWLNGGPGCSSLAYGAVEEIGPFRIKANATGLYSNPYAWNKGKQNAATSFFLANLLFLESPAGVGYSYSNTTTDTDAFGDTRTAEDAYSFLLKWFQRFPQYKSREFYILGESYAGHYVPQLAKLVHDGNKAASKTIINLKGFMVGNAVTDWYYDNLGIVDYYWTHALISDETYTTMKRHCKFTSVELSSECQRIMDYASNQEIGNVDLHSIYTPVCLEATWSSSTGRKSSRTAPHWNPTGFDPCTPSYAEKYFNRPDVQRALHANGTPNNVPHPWTPCNYGILENWHDKAFSVLPIYKELIKAGLRIWVYSGDEDAMVPVTGTRYWIRSLKLPIVNRWYPWYYMDQVAGWSQTYKGLTFATVRGAGHEVPVLQPDRSLSLLEHYLRGKPLPKR